MVVPLYVVVRSWPRRPRETDKMRSQDQVGRWGHRALRACVSRTTRVGLLQASLRACPPLPRRGGCADAERMWWFGVDKPADKQAQYDELAAVNSDQQALSRAAVDDTYHRGTDDDGTAHDHAGAAAHDHADHRGTDDDGPAHDDTHDRADDDDGPAHDRPNRPDDTHDRGPDDDGPAHDGLERRIDLDHDCGRSTVGLLDVIDTLGLDRGRNRSRCRPNRWPRPATACTISPSSSGDMETGGQTGIATGDDGSRPLD